MAKWNGGRQPVSWSTVIVGSALAAMLVMGLVLLWQASRPCGGWFARFTATATGECVGVLEASDRVDDPEIDELIGRFAEANDVVAASGDAYVRVALVTPLSVPADALPAMSRAQIVSSLRGALTAMARANDSAAFGSPNAPRIQMILANQGSRQEAQYGGPLADAIVAENENDPDHPVVAAVGLGSSLPGTATVATALSGRRIPLVSAVASADELNAGVVPRLRSVSPSNSEYVTALREFLAADAVLRSGAIVADQNDDPYTSSLRNAFSEQLQDFVRVPTQSFRGGTVDSGGAAPQVFNPVVANLCNAAGDPSVQLDTVLYAGRVADFPSFVAALADRVCQERPLAVLVGATGFDVARDYERAIDGANLTVVYATSSDAASWRAGTPGTPEGFPGFLDRFRALGFPDRSLDDGYAIMYHDAVAATAVAVRLAGQGRPVPGPADVDVQLDNTSTRVSSVRGASGTLSFPPSPAGTPDQARGRAVGKLVPLRQIGRTTSVLLPYRGCIHVVGSAVCVPS